MQVLALAFGNALGSLLCYFFWHHNVTSAVMGWFVGMTVSLIIFRK